MALTVALSQPDSVAGVKFGFLTFDSSYATGGESLTAADLGLTVIHLMILAGSSFYQGEYDYTNSKVKLTGLGEVASGLDASAVTLRFVAYGKA